MHHIFTILGATTFRPRFKLGKKLCYPNVPSTWVWHTLQTIVCQHFHPKNRILFPTQVDVFDTKCKLDHEDLQKCRYPRTVLFNFALSTIDAYTWSQHNGDAVNGFLDNQAMKSKYPCGVSDHAESTVVIEEGKHFDVISWLCEYVGRYDKGYLVRHNGEEVVAVESLRGNNIMICCVYVPIFWMSSQARDMCALPYAASLGDYELVVVPRMRHNWVHDEDAFNQFVSGLPPSTLVVPFSDTFRRDFLCKSLGLVCDPRYLLVDKELKVVLPPSDSEWGHSQFIPGLPSVNRKHEPHWWKTHSQLDDILDCDPSDFLYNISPGGGKISISELKQKVVGLYLCTDGQFIRQVDLIYKECKARNLEFEVVLIYIPYSHISDRVASPQLFQDAVNRALSIMNISNWWVAPFNDFVSRRIYQVSFDPLQDYIDQPIYDQLIILGPHNEFVDPCGRDVIMKFGINAYPFTRECVVERQLEELSALTLESLLAYGSNDHLRRIRSSKSPSYTNFKEMPLTEVQGKIVLLYADYLCELDTDLNLSLIKWYERFSKKKTDGEFEVVFVDLGGGNKSAAKFSEAMLMPWLWCPFDPEHADFITRTLTKGESPVIAAFGKDGKIISICAKDLLESFGPDDFASYGGLGLRDEVISNFWFWYRDELTMVDFS